MKALVILVVFLMIGSFAAPSFAFEEPKPESISERMSFKFVRGLTNMATSIIELPKQTYITGRDHGAIGYVAGPINGVVMTFYRGFIGLTETVFFMVPQPGYYDPMIDPTYVWQGWKNPLAERLTSADIKFPEEK